MSNNRLLRINSLIKKELSQILLREVDLSKDILVTITRCETSPDLEEANVYISVMPEAEKERIFRILGKRLYGLQQKLNRRLRMRPIPRIKFEKEEKTSQAARIEELLEELKNKGK